MAQAEPHYQFVRMENTSEKPRQAAATARPLWRESVADLKKTLLQLETSGAVPLTVDEAFDRWISLTLSLKRTNHSCYLVGNGASASMASHFAADLSKNAGVRAQVFTDLSQITAIANDISFTEVYAVPLERYAREGDALVTISSSGASPNILAAVKAAKTRNLTVVTLSAFKPDNPLRRMGDLNFYIPADTYGLAETCHSAILHYWIDRLAQ